jgi:hypothetical protein
VKNVKLRRQNASKKGCKKSRDRTRRLAFSSVRFRISWVLLILLFLLALFLIALPGHARGRVRREPHAKVMTDGKGLLSVGA